MGKAGPSEPSAIVLFTPALKARSVQSAAKVRQRHWQPPEGFTPQDALSVIQAARCAPVCSHVDCERNELLLRVLWASGCRLSEALELTPRRVMADSLILPIYKNGFEPDGARPLHRVFLPAGQADLPGALLVWAMRHELAPTEPLFFATRHRGVPSRRPLKAITRNMGWQLVKAASRRAGVLVLALRRSVDGSRGEPAPIHPHLFRHARARHILRTTKSLPLVKRHLGHSQRQMAYLTIGDLEAREMIGSMAE